jgi:hypothetical protein
VRTKPASAALWGQANQPFQVSFFANEMKLGVRYLTRYLAVPAIFVASLSSVQLETEKSVVARSLVAQYRFDEGSGSLVKDSSGNQQDGAVVGNAEWAPGIRGTAMIFNGVNRVTIPSSTVLNLNQQLTVAAWIRGRGSQFRLVKEPTSYPSVRGPYFQVCGDVLSFASTSDRLLPGNSEFDSNLVIGTTDINLSHWKEDGKVSAPISGLEPKLQVVGNTIYYEYFGRDKDGAYQIWTAQSNIDGSDFKAVKRTHEAKGYRVEQGAIEVVGNEIYYSWSQKDERNTWQTWIASSHIDGAGFKAAQKTSSGRGLAFQQIAGDTIYYLLDVFWGRHSDPTHKDYLTDLEIVSSDKRGDDWRVLRIFEGIRALQFQVSEGSIYFAYVQPDTLGRMQLFTGSMKSDGSGFHAVERKLSNDTRGIPGVAQLGIQIVGRKVYYALVHTRTDKNADEAFKDMLKEDMQGRNGFSFWTAEANTDDSQWKATQRTSYPPDILPQYKSIAVVGAKIYHSLVEVLPYRESYEPFVPYFAASGSNIVNKGDAYGLGLTEWNQARAFINAGADYLFRGEAPEGISGAIADWEVDDNWHFVATTYDLQTVKLYVDGELKSSAPYKAAPGVNPFPLIIGDGFVGTIDEVSIYNRALNPREILTAYEAMEIR